ncbi:MAG: FadR family transcriptional regulator [Anaerolineae bacterium]|nr:FadR family transcriptional regulator [Anaerolineae bacterium]
MASVPLDSDLLNYIVTRGCQPGDQLPSLQELSDQLGINVGKLREQLEVARSLGMVDVRPRTGIRCKDYDFLPAVRLSLLFGVAMDPLRFLAFTDLRNHTEVAFWHEACSKLTPEDITALRELVETAWEKLSAPFIQIPHDEHRAFHMRIFARLENPFVIGLLESYWEAYEAVELNTYADLDYWQEAWTYHEKILTHIGEGDFDAAQQAFIAHTRLLRHRNATAEGEGAGAFLSSPQVKKEK